MIGSGDGHIVLRRSLRGENPEALGLSLAEEMLDLDAAMSVSEGNA